MAYSAWSVVAFEQPTAAKWNQLGDNDAYFDTQITALKTFIDTAVPVGVIKVNLPQGHMINGKISRSVASNDLTIAIKTLAGTDPSATDPVYVRIGDTIRTITAALSITFNDGTNWANLGGAELAAQDVDVFVFLGYKAATGTVFLGWSRRSDGQFYGDFSSTNTSQNYFATTTAGIASTDIIELIGRVNVTLSASASYLWTVPASDRVLSKPIRTTRLLTYTVTVGGVSIGNATKTGKYMVNDAGVLVKVTFTWGSTTTASGALTFTVPFTSANDSIDTFGPGYVLDSGTTNYRAIVRIAANSNSIGAIFPIDSGGAANPSANIPMTWATSDKAEATVTYPI